MPPSSSIHSLGTQRVLAGVVQLRDPPANFSSNVFIVRPVFFCCVPLTSTSPALDEMSTPACFVAAWQKLAWAVRSLPRSPDCGASAGGEGSGRGEEGWWVKRWFDRRRPGAFLTSINLLLTAVAAAAAAAAGRGHHHHHHHGRRYKGRTPSSYQSLVPLPTPGKINNDQPPPLEPLWCVEPPALFKIKDFRVSTFDGGPDIRRRLPAGTAFAAAAKLAHPLRGDGSKDRGVATSFHTTSAADATSSSLRCSRFEGTKATMPTTTSKTTRKRGDRGHGRRCKGKLRHALLPITEDAETTVFSPVLSLKFGH